jgi:hypothetical protein
MSLAMCIDGFTILMVLPMLPFKTVLHICDLMDQFNPKNVLKLSKLLILTLLLTPSCLQHMVSSFFFFSFFFPV